MKINKLKKKENKFLMIKNNFNKNATKSKKY